MRILEVRRHTIRSLSSPHISQDGVDLARRVGQGLGKFDRVVTSTLPRAFETALAMGYAVDEQLEQLSIMDDEVQVVVQWNAGYAAWAKAAANSVVVGLYTQSLAELWRSIARASSRRRPRARRRRSRMSGRTCCRLPPCRCGRGTCAR